jgi:hypothetical protein
VAHEEKLIVIDKIFGAVAQKDKALNKRGKNLRRNQKKKEIYFTKINLMLTRGICVNVDMRGGGNARNGGGGPVRRDISVDALVFEDPFLIFAFDFDFRGWGATRTGGILYSGKIYFVYFMWDG